MLLAPLFPSIWLVLIHCSGSAGSSLFAPRRACQNIGLVTPCRCLAGRLGVWAAASAHGPAGTAIRSPVTPLWNAVPPHRPAASKFGAPNAAAGLWASNAAAGPGASNAAARLAAAWSPELRPPAASLGSHAHGQRDPARRFHDQIHESPAADGFSPAHPGHARDHGETFHPWWTDRAQTEA